MAGSLLLKTVRRVTSRTLPSAKCASTASCCQRAGSLRTREPGRTSIFLSARQRRRIVVQAFGEPVADGLRRDAAGREALPPSCGTRPSAF